MSAESKCSSPNQDEIVKMEINYLISRYQETSSELYTLGNIRDRYLSSTSLGNITACITLFCAFPKNSHLWVLYLSIFFSLVVISLILVSIYYARKSRERHLVYLNNKIKTLLYTHDNEDEESQDPFRKRILVINSTAIVLFFIYIIMTIIFFL